MPTVQAIRDGIATRLATISGLNAHSVVPDQITPPAAVVRRRSTTYDTSFDGQTDDLTFAVTVLVQYTLERAAQENLDTYLAPSGVTSVKAAIDAAPTLGGVVNYARVATAEEDRIVEFAGIKYLAADLVVEVG